MSNSTSNIRNTKMRTGMALISDGKQKINNYSGCSASTLFIMGVRLVL